MYFCVLIACQCGYFETSKIGGLVVLPKLFEELRAQKSAIRIRLKA